MAQILERLNLSIVRCFSIAQKQMGVADAMIEALIVNSYPHQVSDHRVNSFKINELIS